MSSDPQPEQQAALPAVTIRDLLCMNPGDVEVLRDCATGHGKYKRGNFLVMNANDAYTSHGVNS